MRFEFKVEVDIDREEGKFATRDEMKEQIEQALNDADPGELEGENGGKYNVTSWNVSET